MKEIFDKKFIFCGLFVFLFVLTAISLFILKIYFSDKQDICLDTGYCKEGLSLNTEFGQITVNKESCIKHNGKWILSKKYCKFK
ncbi:MAG: hypothetical protein VZR09_03745 [Candidatus Gastranaerophilaceae bacterium]|nr:hypothetical protein [Candidatus Gastranaerophilaceae bacterium]